MTESLINPAIDLPKYNALLTRQVIETQREELFTRLVEREAYWINELATHNRTKNPDHHQLASKSSMANAYKSLFPYADRRIQVLSPYDHRNQTITRDTVKECHTVSKLSDIDREQLEVYRSSALFFQFASEMADQGKPITYTQENHNTCVSYRQFYALVSQSSCHLWRLTDVCRAPSLTFLLKRDSPRRVGTWQPLRVKCGR